MARKSRKAAATPQDLRAAEPAKARVWRCAVYARLSNKNNGAADEDSLQAQVAYVRDSLAGRDDVEVAGVFADNGRTGTTFEGRREFDALMDEVRRGAVDCIAVKDLSRFGRNMYETSTYLERIFPFLGVRFIAVNDGLDTLQGDGGIVVPFKGLVNEMYAVETSRKVSAVKRRQMEQGRITYGNTVFGYRAAHGEGRLVPDEATAPFVPLVFDMYLDGERLCDIAEALARMGAPTPVEHQGAQSRDGYTGEWADAPWSARYVARMLDDPVYGGTLVLGKTHRSLFEGVAEHAVPESDRLAFPGAHSALVSEDVLMRARARRRAQKDAKRAQLDAAAGRCAAMPDDFKGVLFCAECGGRMLLDRRFNAKTGEARGSVYKCRKSHGRGCGNCVRLPASVARIAAMDAIRAQVDAAVAFERVLPGLRAEDGLRRRRDGLASRVGALEAEASRLALGRQALYERYAEGGLELADYKRASAAADAEAGDCAARLAAARAELADFDAALASDAGFDEAVSAFDDLHTFSRELLLALVKRVEVDREGNLAVEFVFEDWAAKAEAVERMMG